MFSMSEAYAKKEQKDNPERARNIALTRQRRLERQADKLERVEVNQAEAAQRSPEEQLRRLDARLGAGVGAVRERAKLHAQIAARQTAKAA